VFEITHAENLTEVPLLHLIRDGHICCYLKCMDC